MSVILLDTPKIMDIIGYIGGGILTLNLLPQIYKTWKTKSAKDISYLFIFISIVGFAFYVSYGVYNRLFTIIFPSSISAFLMIILALLKREYDNKVNI